jgi:transcriptional regulator with XRE-family HTH domain
MRFMDRLKELRDKAGLTQQQLAEQSGIPIGSIRNHEQGHRVPSWGSVVKLAKTLGVTCEAFSECLEVQDEPPARKPATAAKAASGKKRKPAKG